MKRFIIFAGLVIIVASSIVIVADYYRLGRGSDNADDLIQAAYKVEEVETPAVISAPDLPDISGDTVESVRAALPALADGPVRVGMVNGLYPLTRDLHIFSKLQKRFDPVVIMIDGGVHTLETLTAAINDPSLLARDENGAYSLFVPISIQNGAALIIGDGTKLYMSADSGALIIAFGRLDIVGADITGWNFSMSGPAHFKKDNEFRPYLTAFCESTMNIAGSHIAHMGYFDTKAYGVSYSSCGETVAQDDGGHKIGGTGRVIASRFDDIYYGFYCYEAHDVRVVRNEFYDSIIYGIDPHDRSGALVIAHNIVRGTKQKHGIIFSRDVQDSYIFGNISENNNRAGLIMDRNSSRNVIAQNILRHNGGDGMGFYESGDNLSYANITAHNGGSGMRIRNSRNVTSSGDVISHNGAGGVQAYTIDLIAAGAYRNLKKDPYEQAVSAAITGAEMVGNTKADITVREVDELTLSSLKRFQSPRRLIAGDFVLTDAPSDSMVLRRTQP